MEAITRGREETMYDVAELREMFLRALAAENKSESTLRVYGKAVD
jgi:hypothetical protein